MKKIQDNASNNNGDSGAENNGEGAAGSRCRFLALWRAIIRSACGAGIGPSCNDGSVWLRRSSNGSKAQVDWQCMLDMLYTPFLLFMDPCVVVEMMCVPFSVHVGTMLTMASRMTVKTEEFPHSDERDSLETINGIFDAVTGRAKAGRAKERL